MRKSIVLAALALWCSSAFAQGEQTLIGPQSSSGGYGGPVFKWTRVDGRTVFMSGGRGGWIINHTFVLGGGGYGFTTTESAATSLGPGELSLGYGGAELEYINSSSRVVHFVVTVHVGSGGVSFEPWSGSGEARDDALFVVEPGGAVELNVARWFRLDLAGSYRFVTGNDLAGLSNSRLAGPSLSATLKFGKF